MPNFIIEEFKHYKVFLYGRNAEDERTDFGIQFRIPSGRAYLKFTHDLDQKNRYETDEGGHLNFYVFLRADKYPAYIDIMRYEKPLFFFYNMDNNQSYVTTSDEPVGEEESSNDDD